MAATLFAAFLLFLVVFASEAFVLHHAGLESTKGIGRATKQIATTITGKNEPTCSLHFTELRMADVGEDNVEATAAEEQAVSAEDADEAYSEEEGDEEEPEDPELVALKEEIKSLEATLKSKRQQVQTMQDRAEHYSKAGYARKVAEMENMRRDRSRLQSSNAADSTALTLAEFLPVLDRLSELKQQYEMDEFGKSYNALADTLRKVYTDLGVCEYTVSTGDLVDKSRMLVVDSEHSEEYPADTVLRPVSMGLELQGYIVRYAECIASLGTATPPPSPEEEEGVADEGEAPTGPEAE